jgi:hypothetical protein
MMINNKNNIKFINYMSKPLIDDTITILYSKNNVKFDRTTVYLDFILSFLHLSFDTYLGDDIMTPEDQINHFNWCWKTNIDNFKKENIHLNDNLELKNYFKDFMVEIYYTLDGKENNKNIPGNIITLWKRIFSYDGIKSRADVDNFIDIYNFFEKSLKN